MLDFKRPIEYKMPNAIAVGYLKANKAMKSKDPNHAKSQEYLCKIVNEEFGIRGNCVKVITF